MLIIIRQMTISVHTPLICAQLISLHASWVLLDLFAKYFYLLIQLKQ
jgi:hypothetical protein